MKGLLAGVFFVWILWVCVVGGLIYAAFHFISKFW